MTKEKKEEVKRPEFLTATDGKVIRYDEATQTQKFQKVVDHAPTDSSLAAALDLQQFRLETLKSGPEHSKRARAKAKAQRKDEIRRIGNEIWNSEGKRNAPASKREDVAKEIKKRIAPTLGPIATGTIRNDLKGVKQRAYSEGLREHRKSIHKI